MDSSTYGQFFGGDCYLVLYTYNMGGRKKYIIYTWWVKTSPAWAHSSIRGTPGEMFTCLTWKNKLWRIFCWTFESLLLLNIFDNPSPVNWHLDKVNHPKMPRKRRVVGAKLNQKEVKSKSGRGQRSQRSVKNKGRSCTDGQHTSVVDIESDVTEAWMIYELSNCSL